ncbi:MULTISPECIES: hypothetical protein [Deinococcus]|jgi:hypothetical protein|uniref:Uncharacterized protein n=2 Tax=Deinococcus TaxID=1298 RepID=A0A221SU46_9DEIO|nr:MULTISPECIES: hypothetical protein [Deinococcus]ASN80164.1 hypothetical protein DFI_03300 [Deinococcus ficus]MDP9764832.1 hypothetical protein [Deinococcus enclensis]
MDLNSWTPDDNARRFATLIATALGTFTFIALWLGLGWNGLLALGGGVLTGVVLQPLLRVLLRTLFR